MDEKKILRALLILLLVVAIFFGVKSCSSSKQVDVLKEQRALDIASKDKLRIDTAKDGSTTASIAALTADKEVLLKYLAEKDKKLSDLQKKNKAIFGAQTSFTTPIDTAVSNEAQPDSTSDVREANIIDPYYIAHVISTKDTTKLRVTPIDTMSITLGEDYRVKVSFANKDARVTELHPFYVKPAPQKSKNWKYFLGIAAGAIGTGLLLK